jgi:hypothetical protein
VNAIPDQRVAPVARPSARNDASPIRRLARHLFTFSAAVSLLLCVAAAAMAVRSFSVEDQLEYLSPDERLLMLISKNGRLDVLYLAAWRAGDDPGFTYMQGSPDTYGGTDYSKRVLGFGADVQLNGGRFVNIPYWFLALAAAVPPFVALKRIRHRRRLNRRGLCAVCGYDLRASPDRCPECGTISSPHSTIERAVPVAPSR